MKSLLGSASVVAFLFMGIAVIIPAQAQHLDNCRERIYRADRHLDHMSELFGRHSDAARDARFDLERIRAWCYQQNRGGHDRDGQEDGRHGRDDRGRSWHGDHNGPRH